MAVTFEQSLHFFDHLRNEYDPLTLLGRGGFGLVIAARQRSTGLICAIKYMPFLRPDGSRQGERRVYNLFKNANREIRILHFLSGALHDMDINPFVLLVDVILAPENSGIFIVTEYIDCDMFDVLHPGRDSYMPLDMKDILVVPRWFMAELLMSLIHIHSAGIMHRDIKPENILVNFNPIDLKLTDYGGARCTRGKSYTLDPPCTPGYDAPEILIETGSYSNLIDMWSTGCVFVELLRLSTGRVFHPTTRTALDRLRAIVEQLGNDGTLLRVFPLDKVQNPEVRTYLEQLELSEPGPDTLGALFLENARLKEPAPGIDLVSKLLRIDPKKRLTAEQAMQHPFFAGMDESTQVEQYRSKRVYPDPEGSHTLDQLQTMLIEKAKEIHDDRKSVAGPVDRIVSGHEKVPDPFNVRSLDED